MGLPAAGWAARSGGGTKVAPEVAEAEGPRVRVRVRVRVGVRVRVRVRVRFG